MPRVQRTYQHSALYQRIWGTVRLIPKGKVATYGQIAHMTGLPGHARMVGYALHGLSDGSNVPWHRVINAQGRISLPKGSSAHARQRRLLQQEGVLFRRGRIDLELFGIEW
jgi:methylated-DNA-protein-cysteine methyltransferase-like protein